MEPSSRGIMELSVGACRQDGRRWAAGPGGRAGLRSGPDGRGTTGRLVTRHGPSGGCARPPVRGAWPKSMGQPPGARQRSPSSASERTPGAPREPAQCLGPPSGAGAGCALGVCQPPAPGGPARREQRGDCLSLPDSRTEVTEAPDVSLQSAVNVCAWNVPQPPRETT